MHSGNSSSSTKGSRGLSSRRGLKWVLIAAAVTILYIYIDEKEQESISNAVRGHSSVSSTNSEQPAQDKDGTLLGKIKSIHILGERNTGTTWVYEHLNECFNHTIPVRRRLKRYKHWFQDESLRSEGLSDSALVLAMFRNVFEWTEAMRNTPHHAPNHMKLQWKEFVTRPWTMDRVGLDLNITDDSIPCQENFLYRDLITCHQRPYSSNHFKKTRYSEHQPFYEMRNDGSGEPYANILEMRAAKITNFLETQHYKKVKAFWILRYEDLLQQGTTTMISRLEKLTGVKATCVPSSAQNRKKRVIDKDMHDWLLEHVDWDAEELIGYTK